MKFIDLLIDHKQGVIRPDVLYSFLAYLDIADIIRLSGVCTDLNCLIDVNRNSHKTKAERDKQMVHELMQKIGDFDKLEVDDVLVTHELKKKMRRRDMLM